MVFSSGVFLFLFLPSVAGIYYIIPKKRIVWKNALLLAASIGFYAWGGIYETILLLGSIIVNYFGGLLIVRHRKQAKLFLGLTLAYNIGIFFIFKYLTFIGTQIFHLLGRQDAPFHIALPIGISFFTFQALSYVVDVYRDSDKVEYSIWNVALYISFFPQLIAGPIVRWDTIRKQITERSVTPETINDGVSRFIIGLGKKALLANQMAVVADKAFQLLNEGNLSMGFAWMGAIAYAFQIYYDFSGYSDMAIGLGKLFGFHFLENFNYPYISRSVTEFWRRWHISLSTWFRDYVYIPLGGSRGTRGRTMFNLLVVWLLTGIWHGANYTFMVWGLLYFCVLLIEKLCIKDYEAARRGIRGAVGYGYTMLIVLAAWVIFRAESISEAKAYLGIMCGFGNPSSFAIDVFRLYLQNYFGFLVLSVLFMVPWKRYAESFKRVKAFMDTKCYDWMKQLAFIGVFLLSCAFIINSAYNPFIYFNF